MEADRVGWSGCNHGNPDIDSLPRSSTDEVGSCSVKAPHPILSHMVLPLVLRQRARGEKVLSISWYSPASSAVGAFFLRPPREHEAVPCVLPYCPKEHSNPSNSLLQCVTLATFKNLCSSHGAFISSGVENRRVDRGSGG